MSHILKGYRESFGARGHHSTRAFGLVEFNAKRVLINGTVPLFVLFAVSPSFFQELVRGPVYGGIGDVWRHIAHEAQFMEEEPSPLRLQKIMSEDWYDARGHVRAYGIAGDQREEAQAIATQYVSGQRRNRLIRQTEVAKLLAENIEMCDLGTPRVSRVAPHVQYPSFGSSVQGGFTQFSVGGHWGVGAGPSSYGLTEPPKPKGSVTERLAARDARTLLRLLQSGELPLFDTGLIETS